MTTLHYIGVPRIGPDRELKWAIERYWRGDASFADLAATGAALRQQQWQRQLDSGADLLCVGDFAWYDQVLEQSLWFGIVPRRFRQALPPGDDAQQKADRVFAVARGLEARGDNQPECAASPMRKWFDTNYHYLVPEWDPKTRPTFNAGPLLEQISEARLIHPRVKVQLAGPLTFLKLASFEGITPDEALDRLVPVYQELLQALANAGVTWVQLDEPCLCTDLDPAWRALAERAYSFLSGGPLPLLVATYFAGLEDNLSLATSLPVQGLHIDLVSDPGQLTGVLDRLGPNKVLSAGVINGRNIWRADLGRLWQDLKMVQQHLGERLWLSTSCSLLHVPYRAAREELHPVQLGGALAFMEEKQQELRALALRLSGADEDRWQPVFDHNRRAREALARSAARTNTAVLDRVAAASNIDGYRSQPFEVRHALQQRRLNLPLLPTTTIGSFPQTPAIRASRQAFRRGDLDRAAYEDVMQEAIADAITRQEKLGLDVLVHGEAERNDMVEYFGEQLEGFVSTGHGWVQSFGTRCVKPPVIYGDVYRPAPMTVRWIDYAQNLTQKPVKGMLTGPTTMMAWSFVRDDRAFGEIASQIALALADEVRDLEQAGVAIIQVDEPALREKLPIRKMARRQWLAEATRAFRLTTASVDGATQIHTHMCYSQFEDILEGIKALDADVITIEAARSEMALVRDLATAGYQGEIGPGLYDIHSPLVPTTETLVHRLRRVLAAFPAQRIWVNPDCGLKTRQWPETEAALIAMVSAARKVREALPESSHRSVGQPA